MVADGSDFRGHSWRGVELASEPGASAPVHATTWIITVLMMLRLAVQVPLYFANNVEALGATRLVMGLPLYALGVWLAWRVSAPEEALVSEESEDAEESDVSVATEADGSESR